MNKKLSESLLKHYSSPAGLKTKEKLRKRSKRWAPIIGKINSEKWKNEEWKDAEMKRRRDSGFYEKLKITMKIKYEDEAFKKEFVEKINKPSRIEKIRKKSKEMWKRAKETNNELYYRMINSAKNKHYELNGYKMNYIEYLIGKILNEFRIEWEYEPIINIDGSTFLPDFRLKNRKVIVECYGDFWHANPDLIKDRKIAETHNGRTVSEVRKYDRRKKKLFENKGYEYIFFWESDIKNNLDNVKNIIKGVLQ